jgi:phenylacetate-CoA ligase
MAARDSLAEAQIDDAGAVPVDHEATRQRHLAHARAGMPEALRRLGMPAAQLQALRTQRLRSLLHIAKTQSAWHGRRLQDIDPHTMAEHDLVRIPPMTKDDVMTHFDEIVTDRRLTLALTEAHVANLKSDAYLLGRYHVNASSGSSGRRALVVHDWDGWAEGFNGFARHFLRAASQSIKTRPIVSAVVAADDPTHASSAMPQTFSDPGSVLWHRFPVNRRLSEIVQGLNQVAPHVLIGYPSMLHQLAVAATAGRLNIRPLLVISVAEPLLADTRAAIGAAWSATLLNFWATTEAAALAVSCGAGRGMHLNDDLAIVELVDGNGSPVAPGTRAAKIFVTNLYNPTPLPLIRYEITDEVTLIDEPCPCGSAHRRVDDIAGRSEDSFIYGGQHRVHPVIFATHLGKERHIVEYQVRQTPHGAAIAIHCNGTVDMARLRTALADDLGRLGLQRPQIEIQQVEAIARQARGKLKRFVPLPTVAGA